MCDVWCVWFGYFTIFVLFIMRKKINKISIFVSTCRCFICVQFWDCWCNCRTASATAPSSVAIPANNRTKKMYPFQFWYIQSEVCRRLIDALTHGMENSDAGVRIVGNAVNQITHFADNGCLQRGQLGACARPVVHVDARSWALINIQR